MAEADDWRLTGQEKYLLGVELVRKSYRARSASWEHDHCSFCWAKFMDPNFSAEHRAAIASDPEVLIEGYTTTGTAPHGCRLLLDLPRRVSMISLSGSTARRGQPAVNRRVGRQAPDSAGMTKPRHNPLRQPHGTGALKNGRRLAQ